ncbi:signal peptidase II [Sediminicurvatus halobius]|uniref:Lipoprotein signal peptidase n=1 Tax=Sediminicurvatus halobius TaxID=2182432 RepID=A0A2U2N7T5_9GAMM|nr:signal peptidase II [Spiribacter halobius]PWG65148.1 signal peptidase II [Spiribacter halobius]UEX78902.1 signal peptidase II [Spiribacter halobius]
MTPLLRLGLLTAAAVLLLDQATKLAAEASLAPYQPVAVLPFLNLMLAFNPGAAFSLLADQPGWQRWFFSALALAVSGYLVWWLRTLPPGERLQAMALGLILGGAIGNLVDRLRLGVVVDFIDLHHAGWHWPAFNVADAGITVGVGLILLAVFRDWRRGR